jgi:hypothetical protein
LSDGFAQLSTMPKKGWIDAFGRGGNAELVEDFQEGPTAVQGEAVKYSLVTKA